MLETVLSHGRLWYRGIEDCGCEFFTSPTQGVYYHVCAECWRAAGEAFSRSTATEDQLELAIPATPSEPGHSSPSQSQ